MKTITKEIKKALDEIKKSQAMCKEKYWEYVEKDPKLAASFSRQAAAYEYAHALVSKAIGAESPWSDSIA